MVSSTVGPFVGETLGFIVVKDHHDGAGCQQAVGASPKCCAVVDMDGPAVPIFGQLDQDAVAARRAHLLQTMWMRPLFLKAH
jgi:hypothetical protein